MAYFHHGSIRKYVAALIDIFNDIEIQYKNSSNETISKNVPIVYSTREKSRILDKYTSEQILSGNYTVLPRSNLSMTGLNKSPQRTKNKNIKINQYKTEKSIDYLFNSVPYEFTFDLVFQCRGMNETTQIIEQICPKFNPTIDVDIFDATNLNEPTRIPVTLTGVDIETDDYSETSSNIFNVVFSLSLQGNLYPPIKSIERVNDFRMRINEYDDDDKYSRKSILNWDVDLDGKLENGEILPFTDPKEYPPTISSIEVQSQIIGANNLVVIFEDKVETISELDFEWAIVLDSTPSGDATITYNKDKAVLTANSAGDIEVQVTITDPYKNYASLNKTITIS